MSIEPTKPEGFVGHYRPKMRPGLKLYAGGEANFYEKWIKRRGAEPVSWGTLDRKALEAAAVGTVCCDTPQALLGPDRLYPRQSFERVLENTLVESEVAATQSSDHSTEAERQRRLVPDQHPE